MFTSNRRPIEKNADLVLVPDTALGDRYNLDGPIVWIPSVVRSAPAWQVQQRVLGRSCFRQFSDEIDDILIVVTNLSTRTPHVHREDQPHIRQPSRLAGILFYSARCHRLVQSSFDSRQSRPASCRRWPEKPLCEDET